MYLWRTLTEEQRKEALKYRRLQKYPKHCPPHFDSTESVKYLVTAACYEHKKIIGHSHNRMTDFEAALLELCNSMAQNIFAWCILPNHYHVYLRTDEMGALRKAIGKLHGQTSFAWNGTDRERGRKVWHNCFERKISSEGHHFATINYVLNNPIHHGYAEKWRDWPWSNADAYLKELGENRAAEIWKKYPILDYGKKWDIY